MRMNIRLKIMDQTDHPFEVDDQTLLSDFRLQVAERLHISPDRQRMIFAGHVLKNENSTLSACGLRDGHVVHLVERPADMPLLPVQNEQSDVDSHADHHHHHHHGRFFPMFGPQRNERERITYVVPFERSGILTDNARVEELVRSAISNIPYLTPDQSSRFDVHWENDQTLHISLPALRNPHIASPALERVSLIGTLLDQVAHFRSVVEAEDGLVDRIDEFLKGWHMCDPGNTTAMNEQVRSVAVALERESISRSRLIDTYSSEDAGEEESDEHAARYETVAETDGNPGYVMRHAITQDLVDILRRLRNEEEALRPHLIRFERILNSRMLYDIDDAEHTDTDYRANFFTVYMEHIQRVLHRLSHAWHLTSDLSVYLHTPMPRRLLPNYQQFRLLPPTEGEIVLVFNSAPQTATSEAASNQVVPTWRCLSLPPPGVDVQELSSDEIRIIGMNPTIRRMQQMGIAVPIPVPTPGQTGGPPGHMMAPRRFWPPGRSRPVPWNPRQPPPGAGVGMAPLRHEAAGPPGLGGAVLNSLSTGQHRSSAQSQDVPQMFHGGTDGTSSSHGTASLQSVEEALVSALEGGLPSLESSNPYERVMRRLLQASYDENVDIANILHNSSVLQALWHGSTRSENGTSGGSSPRNTSSRHPRIPVPSLGSLARGVITQSGGDVPFMSEVISNIMRNNGLGSSLPPQVDVIVEYGDAGQHSGVGQGQSQVLNMAMGGMIDAHGRQPAAVGYHVEVHQFDIFSHSSEQENSSQNHGNVSNPPSSRNDPGHSRQPPSGPPGGFPFLMSGMGFPSEMRLTSPRQDVVNVDPFVSCTSRFTDVQRVLRNSHPSPPSQLSPYRRLMGDAANSLADRRLTSIDAYERVMVALNSLGHVVMSDEDNFENFMQLAVRSALSQMVHNDQDRNSQNARGNGGRIFPAGQSVQLPGGGEIVQATVSAPILVHAEVEEHPDVHSEAAGDHSGSSSLSVPNGNHQQYDFIPRDEEGRNILTEMANTMAVGLDTRVSTILDASHAPASMLRPGNGAGVLAHLEALLLNFATLGDLANIINGNMTPLESHRSHFRAHVIENQLNGNSTPSAEDLLSASVRLAALISSISSVICAAGGELERDWNGRRMNISATVHNVEVATIQRLLRALLDRNISDAEFSHRIQNALRDYARHLVALGNHSFVSADQTAYVRIVYEVLMRADRSAGNGDANLARLLHLRNCILPRVAAFLREEGRFPNLDEIPSRLFVWNVVDEDQRQECSSGRGGSSWSSDHVEDAKDTHTVETEPSTSRGCTAMSHSTQSVVGRGETESRAQFGNYDGSWQQSFPGWVQLIERDILSGQTNPRQLRNPSDIYQSAHPEQARRQMVSEDVSGEDALLSALRETVDNAFHGNIPAAVETNLNSTSATSAFSELVDLAIQRRIQEDHDYDPSRYPAIDRRYTRRY
ncbi:Ubiquitin domain containing protein [Trichostrongylus colubriformis]|uniref:BCL2-associated athanogene 6 n=1 Tax=Trichostrongylus colubriformis TaxID=6319 RepID=A0AAN8F8W2_TRICO